MPDTFEEFAEHFAKAGRAAPAAKPDAGWVDLAERFGNVDRIMLNPERAKFYPEEVTQHILTKQAKAIERNQVPGLMPELRYTEEDTEAAKARGWYFPEAEKEAKYDADEKFAEYQKAFPNANKEQYVAALEQTRKQVGPEVGLQMAVERARKDWDAKGVFEGDVTESHANKRLNYGLLYRTPFVGGMMEGHIHKQAAEASQRVQDGTATKEDYGRLAEVIVGAEKEKEAGKTGMFLSILSRLPTFATEIAATGGLAGGARSLATQAAGKGLAGQVAGRGAQAATLAATAGAGHMAMGTQERMAPQWAPIQTQDGMTIQQTRPGESFAAAASKAYADQFIQMATMGAFGEAVGAVVHAGGWGSLIGKLMDGKVSQAASAIAKYSGLALSSKQMPGLLDMKLADALAGAGGVRHDYGWWSQVANPETRADAFAQLGVELLAFGAFHLAKDSPHLAAKAMNAYRGEPKSFKEQVGRFEAMREQSDEEWSKSQLDLKQKPLAGTESPAPEGRTPEDVKAEAQRQGIKLPDYEAYRPWGPEEKWRREQATWLVNPALDLRSAGIKNHPLDKALFEVGNSLWENKPPTPERMAELREMTRPKVYEEIPAEIKARESLAKALDAIEHPPEIQTGPKTAASIKLPEVGERAGSGPSETPVEGANTAVRRLAEVYKAKGLTDVEQHFWRGFMESGEPVAKLAKEMVNPAKEKPFTRAGGYKALERAAEKLGPGAVEELRLAKAKAIAKAVADGDQVELKDLQFTKEDAPKVHRAAKDSFDRMQDRLRKWGEFLEQEAERHGGDIPTARYAKYEKAIEKAQTVEEFLEEARKKVPGAKGKVAAQRQQRAAEPGIAPPEAEAKSEASRPEAPKGLVPPLAAEERIGIGGGQENAPGAERRTDPKYTALAQEQGRKEEKKQGIEHDWAEQGRQADQKIWDAAKEEFTKNANVGREMVKHLAENPKPVKAEEAAVLLLHKISLHNEYERAVSDYLRESARYNDARLKMHEGGEPPDATRMAELEHREQEVMGEIKELHRVLEVSGSEAGRAFRFRRVMAEMNYSLPNMLLQAEAAKGRKLHPEEIAKINEQAKQIKALEDKIAELEKQYGEKPPIGTKGYDELRSDRIAIERLRKAVQHDREADRAERLTPIQRAAKVGSELLNIPRALQAMIDFPLLRQGAFAALSHPLRTAKGIPEMFRSFMSAEAAERAEYDIHHRPNARLYEMAGLELTGREGKLSQREEGFLSDLISRGAEKGWLVRLLTATPRASERAYQTTMNRIRADSFDAMASYLSGEGGHISKAEAQIIANFANVTSGRGNLGKLAPAGNAMAQVFFSPRYALSRFQTLLPMPGNPLFYGVKSTGMQTRARALVVGEYARMALGLAMVYGLWKAADGDIEWDPRSSDFGKLKTGNTRIDVAGGLGQVATLVSRLYTGESKSPATGKISAIRHGALPYDRTKDRVEYGKSDAAGIIGNYLRGKLAPLPSAAVNVLAGEDVVGKPVTLASEAGKLVSPLFVRDAQEAMEDLGATKGTAVGILGLLGASLQTHEKRKARRFD